MLAQVNGNAYECSDKMGQTLISMARAQLRFNKYAIVAVNKNGIQEMKKETFTTMESYLFTKFGYEKQGFKVYGLEGK